MNGAAVAKLLRSLTSLDQPQDQSVGEVAADVALGFVPGVGTAQSLRDFERARREGDALGMGLSAVGAIPVVGGAAKPLRKIFAGTKGAMNKELEAFKKADDLRKAGKTEDEVWTATGTGKTVESGQPIFEISDAGAKLKVGKGGKPKLEHTALYERYPQLKNYKVEYKDYTNDPGTRGEFDAKTKTIYLNPARAPEEQLSTAIHEMQHAVDTYEGGRAAGSNVNHGRRLAERLRNAEHEAATAPHLEQIASAMSGQGLSKTEALGLIEDQIPEHLTQAVSGALGGRSALELRQYADMMRRSLEELKSANVTPDEWANYFRDAGEARARAAQARLDYDPAIRRSVPPSQTMAYTMRHPVAPEHQLRLPEW
jgi:hypothetical protein